MRRTCSTGSEYGGAPPVKLSRCAPIEKSLGRPSAAPCLARKSAFERTSQQPFGAPYSGAPTLSCVTASPKRAGRRSPCRICSAHLGAMLVIVGLPPNPPLGGCTEAFIAAPSTAKCAQTSAGVNWSDSSYSYCSQALVGTPAPHKDLVDFYEQMSCEGGSVSEAPRIRYRSPRLACKPWYQSSTSVAPVAHKDFSDLYEKMSGKGASASEAHRS